MRALSSGPAAVIPRVRLLLALLLAVAGVLVGLLGMHALSDGAQAGNDAAPFPTIAHSMGEDHASASASCGETGCDELGLMAVGCVLALLAFTLLPARRVRSSARWSAPPMSPSALLARCTPAPSLIALSISRT